MHADSENVRNPLDTAALPPFCLLADSPERAPFLSFWPVSPEMPDGAVNQTCADFEMETSGSANVSKFELTLLRGCDGCQRWQQMAAVGSRW